MSITVVKPQWLKIQPPTETFHTVKTICASHHLVTVCQEAHCPNMAECWSSGTATFMVMGDTCTRGCPFCAIKTAKQGQALDVDEPKRLAAAIKEMSIFDYVVLTSVDRDDLHDGGARHFAACIKEIKKAHPSILVEVLIPDFQGDVEALKTIIAAEPDVIAHNIETVKRLQGKVRDQRAGYEQSLTILHSIKKFSNGILTKTSIMVGLGETKAEVAETMDDIRKHNVDVITFGQYLKPKNKHLAVQQYVHPETFKQYEQQAKQKGFLYVASGPFVRSSYKAGELFLLNDKKQRTKVRQT